MEGLDLTPAFWKGRRIFVTGHTGFKGSWLCLWLLRLEAVVTGYALAPQSAPNLFESARLADAMSSRLGDIRDRGRLRAAIADSDPEIVFHLAAQALVRRSYEEPAHTYESNVVGTGNVLEAMRAAPRLRAAVIVTSDKCYQQRAGVERYREDDALGGSDPYSASKAGAEFVTAAYRASLWRASDAPGVATARSGNVIGGGDWSRDRLVPDLVAAFAAGQPARVRNPNAVRPWQHVLDPLRGYLMLAQRLHAGAGAAPEAGAWNFGPPRTSEWPVRGIADAAARLWGPGAAWAPDPGPHPPEADALRLDSDKAATGLRWHARVPLTVALERTIQWYKKFSDGADARVLVDAELDILAQKTATP